MWRVGTTASIRFLPSSLRSFEPKPGSLLGKQGFRSTIRPTLHSPEAEPFTKAGAQASGTAVGRWRQHLRSQSCHPAHASLCRTTCLAFVRVTSGAHLTSGDAMRHGSRQIVHTARRAFVVQSLVPRDNGLPWLLRPLGPARPCITDSPSCSCTKHMGDCMAPDLSVEDGHNSGAWQQLLWFAMACKTCSLPAS